MNRNPDGCLHGYIIKMFGPPWLWKIVNVPRNRLLTRRWLPPIVPNRVEGMGRLPTISTWEFGHMRDCSTFLRIDLKDWVRETIRKAENGDDWDSAWQETYRELGGESAESGKKGCPMQGTKWLYLLGRIKDSGVPLTSPELEDMWRCSRNGIYSILALEYLEQNPDIGLNELWTKIKRHVRSQLKKEPAETNQGGPTVAFKLWHLDLIVRPQEV